MKDTGYIPNLLNPKKPLMRKSFFYPKEVSNIHSRKLQYQSKDLVIKAAEDVIDKLSMNPEVLEYDPKGTYFLLTSITIQQVSDLEFKEFIFLNKKGLLFNTKEEASHWYDKIFPTS